MTIKAMLFDLGNRLDTDYLGAKKAGMTPITSLKEDFKVLKPLQS